MSQYTPEQIDEAVYQSQKYVLCDWEFMKDHFLQINLRYWAIGLAIYFNINSIEITFLCFTVTIQ